jgi:hypothetical protein
MENFMKAVNDRAMPVGVATLALLEIFFCALIGVKRIGRLTNFAGLYLLVGAAGVTVCAIIYFHYRKAISKEAQSVILALFLTLSFFISALCWALK